MTQRQYIINRLCCFYFSLKGELPIYEEVREKWFNNKLFDSLDSVEDTL